MSDLFDPVFTGDAGYATKFVVCIMLYIAGVMFLYLGLILVSEIFYFIYCKIKQQPFDYEVVLCILTDWKKNDWRY